MKCENVCPICFRQCTAGEQDHSENGMLTVHQDGFHWFWYYTVGRKRKVIRGQLSNLARTKISNVEKEHGKRRTK